MRIRGRELVLVHMPIMRMVQMAVMYVVCMVLVLDTRVSTRSAVRVFVFLVGRVRHHR